ncbi:MAG: gliding motility-associated C-terminal domain-containing protein [Saprospiraceae bacterium]|nr:gliding motility-associated C-terminal domain-containing protein [Saprospiraceae bacterium]
MGFEYGDFTNWQGFTWVNSTVSSVQSTSPAPGFSMQTIMSDTSSYDSNTNYKLRKIPEGHLYSARLGDLTKNTSVATLRYTMKVDSLNALLIYKFAVVLLNPTSGHEKYEEPRFKVTLYDQNNFPIPDCSNYDVFASDAELNKSFKSYYPSGSTEPVLWRDWTTVGADLSAYIGKTITIEFLAADCTHKGHYGYAYFVASCQPPVLSMRFCNEDSIALLRAPQGFESYKWKTQSGDAIGNTQNINVKNPQENLNYICEMTSATGCITTMKTLVLKYRPRADFTSSMLDCHSNKVQFTDLSFTNYGELSYFWDFGDGGNSSERNPVHLFPTSGLHTVKIEVVNHPSTCTDTLIRTVESFSPPLVGITGDSTYCPGEKTRISSYGAAIYEWSTGSAQDFIEIGNPGGNFWMIGRSTTGCISDTLFINIHEEPDWLFKINGANSICEGDSVVLSAQKAIFYNWNTGDTTSAIVINEEGKYLVNGINKRGCKKQDEIFVKVNQIPAVDFNINPDKISRKNTEVIVSIPQEPGVDYYWNFSDRSTATGSTFTHNFDDLDIKSGVYKLTLKSVSDSGCVDTLSKFIIIIPYIPDIFTPDNDGYNDHWKVHLSDHYNKNIEAAIFDRWGEKMIQWKNIQELSWDGRFNGKMVNPGVYVYIIKSITQNGEEVIFSGDVTVLR